MKKYYLIALIILLSTYCYAQSVKKISNLNVDKNTFTNITNSNSSDKYILVSFQIEDPSQWNQIHLVLATDKDSAEILSINGQIIKENDDYLIIIGQVKHPVMPIQSSTPIYIVALPVLITDSQLSIWHYTSVQLESFTNQMFEILDKKH